MSWRRLFTLTVGALALSGCTLISTAAQPSVVQPTAVSAPLLSPTDPFYLYHHVEFANADLYFVSPTHQLEPVARLVSSSQHLLQVMTLLTMGPTSVEASQGFTSYLTRSVRVNQATIDHGIAIVDVNANFAELPPIQQRQSVLQMLETVLANGASRGLEITVNQVPFAVRLLTGDTTRVVTAADVTQL